MVRVQGLASKISQAAKKSLSIVFGFTTFAATVTTQAQIAQAQFDHPMGEVYLENVATGRRINMNERRDGGRIMVMDKDDSTDQKLWLEGNPDNYTFSIWVNNTYTRLSSKGSPTRDGTQLEAWNSGAKGSPEQTIDAVARNNRPGEYLLVFVVNGRGTNQCIDGYPGSNNTKKWSLAYT